MNQRLDDLLRAAEGRFLTADERADLLAWADGTAGRIGAMEEIQHAEGAILTAAMRGLQAEYPGLAQGGQRQEDLTQLLRAATLAMVRDDASALTESLLGWLPELQREQGLPPTYPVRSAEWLRDAAASELSDATHAHLAPMLDAAAAASQPPQG